MSMFMPVSHCFDYCSFVVSIEIRKCETSNFVLPFSGLFWLLRVPNISPLLLYSVYWKLVTESSPQSRGGKDVNTVVSQYMQGIGPRTPSDTKICGCSTSLYKMA